MGDIVIPRDPEKRRRLAEFAGLTDDERHAIDLWCFDQEMRRARGVLLWDNEPRSTLVAEDADEGSGTWATTR